MDRWISDWNVRAQSEQILHIRWLLNPGEPPRRNVGVVICSQQIAEIRDMPEGVADRAHPLILIPPLVNAHTHLEFSGLREPLSPANPFPEWIGAVIRHRRQAASGGPGAMSGIAAGLAESAACGVRAIGEITTGDISEYRFIRRLSVPPQLVSFREIIGLNPDSVGEKLDAARLHLDNAATAGVMPGLSPHAPYSVHPETFHAIVDLAIARQAPVAMHLAETQDEIELLASGTGRFVDFLSALELWQPSTFPGGSSPQVYLQRLAKVPRAIAVHGNFLNERELAFVASNPQIAVVHCPRTFHYFGHDRRSVQDVPPRGQTWYRLLQSGARVLLGTDSRASSPDLSIWSEFQHVLRLCPELTCAQLLPLMTTSAADALALNPESFRLTVGRAASGVLLNCSGPASEVPDQVVRQMSTQPVYMLADGLIISPASAATPALADRS